jgi:hypothetical protein
MKNKILRHDTICCVCKSNAIINVMKFEDTPLEDQFVKEKN